MYKGKDTEAQKSEVLQGTLDLMVLKVLDALGPQHGYGIARRIEQVSEQVLRLSQLLHLSARTRCRWSLRFQVSYLTLLLRRTNRFGPP